MGSKEPEQAAAEEQQGDTSSKKRKSSVTEIEVDLTLPEPPSKKARRALKKGKTLPAKPTSDDEDGEDGKTDGAKEGKKKKERSPYGVWIGNLRFMVTKPELRKWLIDNSGGTITDELITRVHMPTTKAPAGPGPKRDPENRGFAYVDFATFEANVAAIALSETEYHGRKLLIKDSKSFEGRPKKEEPAPVAADGTATSETPAVSGSTKIFVGNLSFNTTEDDLHAQFEKCGKIRWIKVATFEDSGKCKGYGWVNFEEAEAAAWAVKGFVKVRETVETLEDFMDDDAITVAAGEEAADGQDKANDDSDKDDDDESSKPTKPKPKNPTTSKEPARVRTRKWWVNQLLGRTLKIELAEDDQTRYNKRFRKGGTKNRQQQQQQQQEQQNKPGRRGQDADNYNGVVEVSSNDKAAEVRAEKKKPINYQADINVARLTGAPVAHQGKKVTFE